MGARAVDRAIAVFSRRQYGAFSRAQVLAAGGTDSLIARRLGSGTWVRLAPGVYASADVQPTWHRQVMAATLVHEGLVAAAGTTAAVLYGADGFRPGRPQLLVAHDLRASNPLARVCRSRRLLPTDVIRIAGIPVLTMERLAVDLAPSLDKYQLGRLVDRGVILRKLDPETLVQRAGELLDHLGGGLGPLAEVLQERWTGVPPAASELEVAMYGLLDRAGFTGYVRQAAPPWFPKARGGIVLDTLFPDDRVILEGDGRLWHAQLEQIERDKRRDAIALAHGYVTLRPTWRMITRTPQVVVAALNAWVRLAA
jgi:hypothetical protein